MTIPNHIQDELQRLESSLPLNQASAFTVPQGYFEGFAASVLAKVKGSELSASDELAGLSPLLAGLSKKNVLSVPDNYFSTLTPVLETEEESSLLAGISRLMPNTVPAVYFEGFANNILRQVAPQEAKVVSFNRKRWIQMAAAAVVAGIMAVSGFAYFGGKSTTNVQSTAWMEKGLKGVSNETLDNFIQTTDAVHSNDVAMNAVHTAEVRTMMTDVSDKEMDAFLAQVPTDDEELLIIN